MENHPATYPLLRGSSGCMTHQNNDQCPMLAGKAMQRGCTDHGPVSLSKLRWGGDKATRQLRMPLYSAVSWCRPARRSTNWGSFSMNLCLGGLYRGCINFQSSMSQNRRIADIPRASVRQATQITNRAGKEHSLAVWSRSEKRIAGKLTASLKQVLILPGRANTSKAMSESQRPCLVDEAFLMARDVCCEKALSYTC